MTPLTFVVLWHDMPEGSHRASHFDLLLERAGSELLAAWELARPLEDPPQTQTVRRLADHRRIYLDYQGPIAGSRGQVKRIDRGTVTWLESQPSTIGEVFAVELRGERYQGRLIVRPLGDERWEASWTSIKSE